MREWLDRRDGGGFDRMARLANTHAPVRPGKAGGMAAPGCTTATRLPGEVLQHIATRLMVPALPRTLTEAVARVAAASLAEGFGDVWFVRHPDGMQEAMTPSAAASMLAGFDEEGGFLVLTDADREAIAEVTSWREAPRMAA